MVDATKEKPRVGGHPVYGAFFAGDPRGSEPQARFIGQGYSNRTARGTARGDEPESMYAVFSGRKFGGGCCFDYSNAENVTRGKEGNITAGSMEAIYWQGGRLGAAM